MMFELRRWPNWLRWAGVVVAPFIAFPIASLVIGLMAMATGEGGPGTLIWLIGQPACGALAAVAAAGAMAPARKLLSGVYAMCLLMIFITLASLEWLLAGEYLLLVSNVALLVGGGIGLKLIDDDETKSRR